MFLLVDHTVAETSSNNGSVSVSRYASGANVNYSEKIDEAYDQAIELAGSYGDTAAQGKLTEMKKRHLDYALKYKTNQDSLEMKVEASGHGWALDRKRGWEDATVTARVVCVLPLNLAEQLRAYVGLRRDDVVITNRGITPYYVSYATVAPIEACSVAKKPIVLRLNRGQNEVVRLPVNSGKSDKLCTHFYSSRPQTAAMLKMCENTAGSAIDIGAGGPPAQCFN